MYLESKNRITREAIDDLNRFGRTTLLSFRFTYYIVVKYSRWLYRHYLQPGAEMLLHAKHQLIPPGALILLDNGTWVAIETTG